MILTAFIICIGMIAQGALFYRIGYRRGHQDAILRADEMLERLNRHV